MTTAALSTPKDHALRYHGDGFSVFILRNPDAAELAKDRKRPAVNWELYQIMRPSQIQIERWFSKNPNYNLAIAMGNASKAVAVDVDGQTAFERIKQKIPEMSSSLREALANTMKNQTGGGGEHIIFRMEDPTELEQVGSTTVWTDGKEHSEIKIKGNGGYIVMPPSRHPNGELYQWNGKELQAITKQELDEFVRLVSPKEKQQSRPQSDIVGNPYNVPPTARTLTPEKMQELLSWIKPYYTPGTRDHIIFFLSGMFRKDGGFSLSDARAFIELLCNESGYPDEDLDKSLEVVDNTYKKDSLESLNGKSGLHDLLVTSHETVNRDEYLARAEAFSQICQIVNSEPSGKFPEDPVDDPSGKGGSGGGGDADDNDNNKSGAKVVHSGVKLLRDKTVDDDNTRIISYLANEVMSRVALKSFFDTHEIIYYDARRKYYHQGGERIIDAEIEKIVEEIKAPFTVRSYIKAEVQKCIADRNIVNREDFDADPYTINLENCLLDVISLEQMEQTSEYLTMSKFPVVYNPDAESPRIERFLGEVIQDLNTLREVLKFIGYILLKDCRYEKALLLLGPGSNGKSKLIAMLEAFVGQENCSNLSLHDLEEDKFARARLFSKTLNTYADNKSQRLKETGNIKTVISGDRIEGQNKFKPRFSFKPRAKIIVSTNNPPETEDKTHAFYRRWLIPSLERIFVVTDDPKDPNRRDPDLEAKITRPEELSGLLNLALKYLSVLIRENGFVEEPMDKVKQRYESKANHVSKYLAGYCRVDDTGRGDYYTKTEDLYNHYVKICEQDNVKPLAENMFGSELLKHDIQRKQRRVKGSKERKRENVYESVVLKEIQSQTQDTLEKDYVGSISVEGMPANNTDEEDDFSAFTIGTECPHCALPGMGIPITKFDNNVSLRDYQLHCIFKHPGLKIEEHFLP